MNAGYVVALIAAAGSAIVTYPFIVDPSSTSGTIILVAMPVVVFGAVMLMFSEERAYSDQKRFPASVVSIHDGDTLKMDFHGRIDSYRIRFIDTPEVGQKGGEESAAMLAALLRFKYVEFVVPEKGNTNTYGRIVCEVYANDKNIGLEMVRRGYAWVDTRYPTPPEYIEAFAGAVRNKRGIFVKGFPQHPELWRHKSKKKVKPVSPKGN